MTDSEPLRCPLCGAALSLEQTECAACGEAILKPEPVGKFRWRFIPTALLTIFGGLYCFLGVAALVMSGATIVYQMRGAPSGHMFIVGLGSLCCGAFWLLAGHWCWHRRWVRCVLAFATGCAVIGIMSQFLPG
jgi:hypothetical protein